MRRSIVLVVVATLDRAWAVSHGHAHDLSPPPSSPPCAPAEDDGHHHDHRRRLGPGHDPPPPTCLAPPPPCVVEEDDGHGHDHGRRLGGGHDGGHGDDPEPLLPCPVCPGKSPTEFCDCSLDCGASSFCDCAEAQSDSCCGATNSHDSDECASHAHHTHVTTKHIVHGALMAGAALLFFPSGAFVARAAKLSRGDQDKASFNAHRLLQLCGFACTVAGITIALLMVEGCHFWAGGHGSLHGFIGMALLVALSFQVILGVARPSKDSDKRQRWASAHKMLGHAAGVGMLGNCLLGAGKYVGDGVVWPLVTVAVGVGAWLLGFMALQVKTRKRGEAPAAAPPDGTEVAEVSVKSSQTV